MVWKAEPLLEKSLAWKGVRGYTSTGGIKMVGLRAQVFIGIRVSALSKNLYTCTCLCTFGGNGERVHSGLQSL